MRIRQMSFHDNRISGFVPNKHFASNRFTKMMTSHFQAQIRALEKAKSSFSSPLISEAGQEIQLSPQVGPFVVVYFNTTDLFPL